MWTLASSNRQRKDVEHFQVRASSALINKKHAGNVTSSRNCYSSWTDLQLKVKTKQVSLFHFPGSPDSLLSFVAHDNMNTDTHWSILTWPPSSVTARHAAFVCAVCVWCAVCVRVRAWDCPASRQSLCFHLLPSNQSLNHVQAIC